MKEIKEVHIFKSGTVTDSNQNTSHYSASDLENIASNYDPAVHEAPIVWGHEADSAWHKRLSSNTQLANGWVTKLFVKDGDLYADIKVDDSTYDAIKGEKLKKRSVGFYDKKAKHNPTPGSTYIRHLALLGQEPPAIKGLNDIKLFSENTMDREEAVKSLNENASEWLALILKDEGNGFGETIIRFEPEPSEDNNWLWNDEAEKYEGQLVDAQENTYDFSIEKSGDDWSTSVQMTPEDAAKVEDGEAVEADADADVVVEEADTVEMSSPELEADAVEEDESDELAELRKFKEQAEVRMAEMQKFMEDKMNEEREARYSELSEFCDCAYGSGKMTPSVMEKATLLELLKALLGADSMMYSDGEHDVRVIDGVKALINSMPTRVEFSDSVTNRAVNSKVVKVPEQYGEVSEESKKEYMAIKQYMDKEGITDFREGRRKYMVNK